MNREAAPLIVYAEDDDDTRDLVRRLFEREGFRVETAATAEGLIETVNRLCNAEDCPDLILTDVNFFNPTSYGAPKLTGIGAAYKINLKFPNLPILFLTAHDDRTTKQNAREASGSEVLSKPFVPAELVARVRLSLQFGARRYEGTERRRHGINRTNFKRRATDRPIEIPRVVSEAVTARAEALHAKGAAER